MKMFSLPRSFVASLAGLLVFTTVLLLPQPAQATVPLILYGAEVDEYHNDDLLEWHFINLAPECKGSAFWVAKRVNGVLVTSIQFKTDCKQWGGAIDPFRNAYAFLHIKGTNQAGVECEVSGNSKIDWGAVNSWTETTTTIELGREDDPVEPGTVLVPGLGGLCTPNRIESSGQAAGHGWAADLDLGPRPDFGTDVPDSHSTTCTYGKPIAVDARLDVGNTNGTLRDRVDPKVTFTGSGATGRWRGYMYYTVTGSSNVRVLTLTGASASVDMAGQTEFEYPNTTNTNTTTNTNGVTTIIGFEVAVISPTISQSFPGTTPVTLSPGDNAASATGTIGYGVTDPSKCRFWFGPKVYTSPSDTFDEPWVVGHFTAPTGEEVEPDPAPPTIDDPEDPTAPDPACDFDIGDPGSWISGSACALVGLLGKIVDLLLEIFNAIVGLVGELSELLVALFVPDPTTWGIDGLQTQFQERPPGSLVSGAASGVSGMGSGMDAGGCGTLIDVSDSFPGGGGQITCSAVKNVPGYSAGYSIFTLCIYALTGLAVFRMFTGALNSGHD